MLSIMYKYLVNSQKKATLAVYTLSSNDCENTTPISIIIVVKINNGL